MDSRFSSSAALDLFFGSLDVDYITKIYFLLVNVGGVGLGLVSVF